MATFKGQLHSYSNTLPQKRTVSDRILMTDPMEIAMISALGLNNESKFSFVNTPGKIYEWLEDGYVPRSTTVASQASLTNDTTTTVLSMTDGTPFQVGDVISIDDEYMWVSTVSANSVTVTRGFNTTAVTHLSTSTVYIRYNARLEGADAGDSPATEASSGYNYSTILQKTIEVSRTDARIPKYGIPDIVEREIDKAMDELKMNLTRIPFHGVRKVGSSSAPRSSGGLDTFITTNLTTLTSTPALTQKNIEDAIQNCWTEGGLPDLLVCGAWAKRKISDFYAGYVRTERSEKLGGVVIDNILSPLGINLAVMVDRHCPADKLYILDTRHVGFVTIDDFFYEDLGKVGDTAAYGQIVGEYGFACAAEGFHAIVDGFSTSS